MLMTGCYFPGTNYNENCSKTAEHNFFSVSAHACVCEPVSFLFFFDKVGSVTNNIRR